MKIVNQGKFYSDVSHVALSYSGVKQYCSKQKKLCHVNIIWFY